MLQRVPPAVRLEEEDAELAGLSLEDELETALGSPKTPRKAGPRVHFAAAAVRLVLRYVQDRVTSCDAAGQPAEPSEPLKLAGLSGEDELQTALASAKTPLQGMPHCSVSANGLGLGGHRTMHCCGNASGSWAAARSRSLFTHA